MQERQEVVAAAAVEPGRAIGAGRLDDQRRVQLAVDQDESAGDAEDGLLGHEALPGSPARCR